MVPKENKDYRPAEYREQQPHYMDHRQIAHEKFFKKLHETKSVSLSDFIQILRGEVVLTQKAVSSLMTR